jgi:hypothetical protein
MIGRNVHKIKNEGKNSNVMWFETFRKYVHVASIFRVEIYDKQGTIMKMIASYVSFFSDSFFDPDDGNDVFPESSIDFQWITWRYDFWTEDK